MIFKLRIHRLAVASMICFVFSTLFVMPNSQASQRSDVPVSNTMKIVQLGSGMTPALSDYFRKILVRSLQVTQDEFGPFELSTFNPDFTNAKRRTKEVSLGKRCQVGFTTHSKYSANQLDDLHVIDNPFLHNLLGLRQSIVNRQKETKLTKDISLAQFKKLRPGQGELWEDTIVYRNAGISVAAGMDVDALFSMLQRGRFDYFPLSILEVEKVMASVQKTYPEMEINPEVYVYYPFSVKIIVSKSRPRVVARISKGIKKLESSGELEALFLEHYAHYVKKVDNGKVKVFILRNYAYSQAYNDKNIEDFINYFHLRGKAELVNP